MQIEKLIVCDYNIAPCQECGDCKTTGKCKVDDDMQAIYPKLLNADVLIIGSPIFFKGLPAQLKALIDRCQCLWAKKYVLKKPLRDVEKLSLRGYFVSAGGLKTIKTFDGAILTLKAWFVVLNMAYSDQLVFPAIDEKDSIQKVPGALDEAFELGKRLLTLK